MKASVLIFALATAATVAPAAAQQSREDEEKAVLAVVNRLFDGMRTRDTVALKAVFAPNARLLGLSRDGQNLNVTTPEQFIGAIARATGPAWNETIYKPEIRVDQNLATVWTEYDFHAGTQFSHCGIDAFQLLKFADGWKIVSLADTRRQQGCPARPGR